MEKAEINLPVEIFSELTQINGLSPNDFNPRNFCDLIAYDENCEV